MLLRPITKPTPDMTDSVSLEQIAYIAEIIGVIAVVVSLLYLAIQVRMSARATRLASAHSIAESWRDTAGLIAAHGDLADILTRGFVDRDSLTGAEKLRFHSYLQNLLKIFEDAYYNMREETLEEEFWDGIREWFTGLTDLPGTIAYWNELKFCYSPQFQRFMDETIIPAKGRHGWRVPGT